MTTIQLLDVSDPPAPPPPLDAKVAVMIIALLAIGGGILAALAGPETAVEPAEIDPTAVEADSSVPQVP